MMHLILLLTGLICLVIIVRKMVKVEMKGTPTDIGNEAKHNAVILLWGIGILFLILFIPYQVWKFAGGSLGLDGVVVLGLSLIGSVLLCFSSYYIIKGRQLKSKMPSL
ncbi:hypothetical protein FIU87_04315 [Bacillus sp. THAF10]|uniref:hypothetical protein n=1 Tax=Bacillus sp. THAF10 TaxID=2587848 RepID=UPI001268ACBA|nr:hypothetical protein [Bacillus sp. THAF10]QFT87871.1 hypothetical protein FIU87_04315 [Bacillus sp. THAF10]